jgi:hypothetical protein
MFPLFPPFASFSVTDNLAAIIHKTKHQAQEVEHATMLDLAKVPLMKVATLEWTAHVMMIATLEVVTTPSTMETSLDMMMTPLTTMLPPLGSVGSLDSQ